MTVSACTTAAPITPTTAGPAAAPVAVSSTATVAEIFAMDGGATVPTTGSAPAPTSPTVTSTTGGGAGQALQGVDQQQLVAALQQVIAAVNQLVVALQAQQPTAGGGMATTQCDMPGCSGAPGSGMPLATQVSFASPAAGAAPVAAVQSMAGPAPAAPVQALPQPAPAGAAPRVKDKTSTNGLSAPALRGLEEAHRFGLPLVSGHRPGGPSSSDHTHGNAIDVGTLPISAASSTEGTPEMKAFAEHMRLAGKAGQLNVKYVILDGRIASSKENWEWRTYTYPGKTAAEMEALKQSNRGEYNRMQHYDHVHVSFN